MMLHAIGPLAFVKGTGPGATDDRLSRKLMKALFDKPGTGKATMDPFLFAAYFRYRRDARVFCNFFGVFKAISICSHRSLQSRSENGTSSRETAENFRIWLFLIDGFDTFLEVGNGLNQRPQLKDDGLVISTDDSTIALSVVKGCAKRICSIRVSISMRLRDPWRV